LKREIGLEETAYQSVEESERLAKMAAQRRRATATLLIMAALERSREREIHGKACGCELEIMSRPKAVYASGSCFTGFIRSEEKDDDKGV
jgi:hypothetical protein